jgi:hypothetical protein
MAILLLPSRHWLKALGPLTVACVALIWSEKKPDQQVKAGKFRNSGLMSRQIISAGALAPGKKENAKPEQPLIKKPIETSSGIKINIQEEELTEFVFPFRTMCVYPQSTIKNLEQERISAINKAGYKKTIRFNIDLD